MKAAFSIGQFTIEATKLLKITLQAQVPFALLFVGNNTGCAQQAMNTFQRGTYLTL